MKNKTSTDYNDVSMLVMKQVINEIAEPLTYIYNKSLQSGIFPKGMKTDKVVPIFKGGDEHHYTNHRQIYIISQFSKIKKKYLIKD